jgi:hypothetical protein
VKKLRWVTAHIFYHITMPSVKDIYLKIKMAEEYLNNLRIKLQEAEATGKHCDLAKAVAPFVDSTWASAKAAALAGGLIP